MTDRLSIDAPDDGGNIAVLDASDPSDIRLAIEPDANAPFHQWFCFDVEAPAGRPVRMVIENAGQASYVPGWRGYRAVASEDGEDWRRVETAYEGGALIIRHAARGPACRYAYFAPYGRARYDALIAGAKASALVRHDVLGRSLDGADIDRVTVGDGPLTGWVIARQHPGETMGSWWMEGFVRRLLDADDADARALRAAMTLRVVPMMNPDGARRGHLRTNAAGTDLNRAWAEPDAGASPEVLCVRNAMEETGLDVFLDVHGDEAIANNFIAGAKGVPGWTDRLERLEAAFEAALLDASDSFQTVEGYGVPAPGRANLKIATNWVCERFDALAMTLEMPFKDAAVNPDPVRGWSPERCRRMGRDCLTAIARVAPQLR